MRFSTLPLSGLALAVATPAFAQDAEPADAFASSSPTSPPSAFTVTGGGTVITDYRFRGLTQTNGDPAVQGTVNVNHASGFYVGTWASTIDGGCDGSTPALTCYGGAEVDLYGGFTKTFSGFGVDVGLLYYYYPTGKDNVNTDFFEPYASVSYTIGPVAAKAGLAYAWGGQKGLNFTSSNDDNIYLYGEGSVGIPSTPITLKGHVGYTDGSLGIVNINPANETYWDWSVTAEAVLFTHFKAGVSYVDSSVTNKFRFASRLGRDATVLGYVGFSF